MIESEKKGKGIGFELEEKMKLREAGFHKSEQQILAQMREANQEEWDNKMTTSLRKAFNTKNEKGVPLTDEIACKVAAHYKQSEKLTMKDVIDIKDGLGESSTKSQLNVNLGGKIDITKELEKLADKEEY